MTKNEQALKDYKWIVASGQYKQGRLTAIVNKIKKLEKLCTGQQQRNS